MIIIVKVRVGCYEGHETVDIDKPYDLIKYKDVKKAVGSKTIIGWYQ